MNCAGRVASRRALLCGCSGFALDDRTLGINLLVRQGHKPSTGLALMVYSSFSASWLHDGHRAHKEFATEDVCCGRMGSKKPPRACREYRLSASVVRRLVSWWLGHGWNLSEIMRSQYMMLDAVIGFVMGRC
jgi:hypothetical protein